MGTSFSHYKWRHLLCGLKVSSEVFQKCMQTAFWDMDDSHLIADDILICGYGETLQAANGKVRPQLGHWYIHSSRAAETRALT